MDAEGFVTDSYEQKFAVPDDVDTARLSSGISKDGVLMIRVPRRPTEADRLIPIQYDAKIEAVEKALSQAMQSEKVRPRGVGRGNAPVVLQLEKAVFPLKIGVQIIPDNSDTISSF